MAKSRFLIFISTKSHSFPLVAKDRLSNNEENIARFIMQESSIFVLKVLAACLKIKYKIS